MGGKHIDDIRRQIDDIDRQILRLLDLRGRCALETAAFKRQHGLPCHDPDRERTLLAALCEENQGLLADGTVRRIFREIVSACRALQGAPTVSYLGPEDTFCHLAAMESFGTECTFRPRGSISDVFREVEHGGAEFGVVPAENSINGAVGVTLDEWVRSDLKIVGEILLPVSQCLMSKEPELSRIQTVLSHPQALAQCRDWLARNLPGVAQVETLSTAAAACRASESAASAALGPENLADRYDMSVLARNIQDRPLNLTRFFVIGRRTQAPSGRDKTSVLFVTAHKPGALYRTLEPLAEMGINMTCIESRPSQDRPWTYVFFADIEGHQEDERVRTALARVADQVDKFKILGSYPVAACASQEMDAPALVLNETFLMDSQRAH